MPLNGKQRKGWTRRGLEYPEFHAGAVEQELLSLADVPGGGKQSSLVGLEQAPSNK